MFLLDVNSISSLKRRNCHGQQYNFQIIYFPAVFNRRNNLSKLPDVRDIHYTQLPTKCNFCSNWITNFLRSINIFEEKKNLNFVYTPLILWTKNSIKKITSIFYFTLSQFKATELHSTAHTHNTNTTLKIIQLCCW